MVHAQEKRKDEKYIREIDGRLTERRFSRQPRSHSREIVCASSVSWVHRPME